MFNFFKKSTPQVPEQLDVQKTNDAPLPINDDSKKIPLISLPDDGYTVGYSDGNTILKLKAGNNYMTLTLPPEEVYRLIRLLAASMDDEQLFDDEPDVDVDDDE